MNPKTNEQDYGRGKRSRVHVPGERAPVVADADKREKEKADDIRKLGLTLDVLETS